MSIYTRETSVYIMTVPSGYLKVGHSRDPERRLAQIQAEFYERITLDTASLISDGSPVRGYELEQLMHLKLRPFSTSRREWFAVDVDWAITLWAASFRFLAMPVGHPDMSEELCAHFHDQLAPCFYPRSRLPADGART